MSWNPKLFKDKGKFHLPKIKVYGTYGKVNCATCKWASFTHAQQGAVNAWRRHIVAYDQLATATYGQYWAGAWTEGYAARQRHTLLVYHILHMPPTVKDGGRTGASMKAQISYAMRAQKAVGKKAWHWEPRGYALLDRTGSYNLNFKFLNAYPSVTAAVRRGSAIVEAKELHGYRTKKRPGNGFRVPPGTPIDLVTHLVRTANSPNVKDLVWVYKAIKEGRPALELLDSLEEAVAFKLLGKDVDINALVSEVIPPPQLDN